jgi:NAD(P)-dependent dehydrogenase (short-subunit alcohol dehydrogenase family)
MERNESTSRVAIVTGLGRAMALGLARAGIRVIATAARASLVASSNLMARIDPRSTWRQCAIAQPRASAGAV